MADARPGLFSLNRPLSRGAYAAAGVVLMAVKYWVDHAIARFDRREWMPWSYFMWPGAETVGVAGLSSADRRLALSLLLVALPFVVAGVILTVQRLRAVELPVAFLILFFVPLLNVALFFVLLFAPDAGRIERRPPRELPRPKNWDAEAAELWRRGGSFGRAATLAWIVTVPATLLLLLLGVTVLRNYGWGVFVGIPFLLGFLSVVVFTRGGPRSWNDCVLVMLGSIGLTALTIVLVAFEGLVCLLMALPIALMLSWFGAYVAYTIQRQRWNAQRIASLCLTLFALAPALMAAERADAPEPELRAVVTSVVVAAPPELVWKRVVSFPPIPPPQEWLFAAGIAAPLSAEIDGAGAGAIRRCVFTTGAFVEPIDRWDEPRLLHFAVTGQPPPMREWSPYAIHPPHLDGFLVSRAGQFRLEPLADGRTLLEGTTWYSNRMWPACYWNLWSDAFIHAIHRRVLDHVGAIAQADARAQDLPMPR
jgi:hypothetical protein